MGIFNKKPKKEDRDFSDIPELPELPKLPELPINDLEVPKMISQLPRFPNNNLGNKFSQNTIKEAIAGEEESEEEGFVNEFEPPEEIKTIQKPLLKLKPFEINQEKKAIKEEEPLFVRLDKFEESQKILEDLKKQIREINHLLAETSAIKEKEEEQLKECEIELQNIKNSVEKIDKDLFSKL